MPLAPLVVLLVTFLAVLTVAALGARSASPLRSIPYTLLEPIGAGGMGVVYRAKHERLDRLVALKLMQVSDSRTGLERFEQEVRSLSRLNHPNIVTLHDFGRIEGGAYCAMELLEGLDLEQVVARAGAQDPRRVVHILVQACSALAEAHAAGFVHRDVKPANIFLCRNWGSADVVKLLDFGLAKPFTSARHEGSAPRLEGDVGLTGEAQTVGTPRNMAPECFSDPARVGPLSDVYSLGTVAYLLLSGAPVFRGRSLAELCAEHLYSPPVPLVVRAPRVSAELAALVMRCLDKTPERRPAGARALCEALLACPEAGAWCEAEARAWWRDHDGPAEPSSAAGGATLADTEVEIPSFDLGQSAREWRRCA